MDERVPTCVVTVVLGVKGSHLEARGETERRLTAALHEWINQEGFPPYPAGTLLYWTVRAREVP